MTRKDCDVLANELKDREMIGNGEHAKISNKSYQALNVNINTVVAFTGTPNDCLRCQCPGGSSGNQFSKTCFLDSSTVPPSSICDACDVSLPLSWY